MKYALIIEGRLAGLNEYTAANRTSPHQGGTMKRTQEELCILYIRQQLSGVEIHQPVQLSYTFYEPNRKRDLDNISSFAHKVIQDALVKTGVLQNDGWKEITGYQDTFACDPQCPRIEVTIEEREEGR